MSASAWDVHSRPRNLHEALRLVAGQTRNAAQFKRAWNIHRSASFARWIRLVRAAYFHLAARILSPCQSGAAHHKLL